MKSKTLATILTLRFMGPIATAAEPSEPAPVAVPMIQALKEMDEAWRRIEPHLFESNSSKKYIGEWVRCSGKPLSLKPPITIKLSGGTIVKLTKLQGADKNELATFKKPPSTVTVHGPIVSVDRDKKTVTIKAVSTMFAQ